MVRRTTLGIVGATLLLVPFALRPSVGAEELSAEEKAKFFETQVQPILQTHCLSCHGGEKKVRGGLKLTSREAILKGGENGPAISEEKSEDSRLLMAVRHEDSKMPPKGKLPQSQIDILTRWVKMGVPWSNKAVVKHHGPPPVDDAARNFWSFRPVVRPAVPEVKRADWVKNPIDAFILAKLEAAGLAPAPAAEKTVLIRRLTYDLTGLPPTQAEVDAFLADNAPDAYEKLVDRLLESPGYGEHWARHWLDLVRYAETNSFERDGPKPFMWRYRDYVIRSLNEDKPYDQFIREQLAGDELDKVTNDTIIATGYYCLGTWDDEPPDRDQAYFDELDDIVATTGQTFLGLTVNCARCHDHKIDPFPQKDYYRMLSFFRGMHRFHTVESLRSLGTPEEQRGEQEAINDHKKKLQAINDEMRGIEDKLKPHLQGGERDDFKHEVNKVTIIAKHVPDHLTKDEQARYLALREQRGKLDQNRPTALAQALSIREHGARPPDTYILGRGNVRAPGEKVEPGFPSVVTAVTPVIPEPKAAAKTAGRRRILADWVASKENPLTTRVMANRLWQFHFGRGIVRSSSDFGYGGTPPTHPELLDWLASEFVSRGWKLKAMHKLIVTSNAYRMSSQPNETALAKDPENDRFWRFDPRRLSAEEVRDSILAACGNLSRKMAGPSIYPKIPQEVLAGQSVPGNGWDLKCPPEERARRSVYVHIKRSLQVPSLAAFDAPDPDGSCPVRFITTQPGQALGLLNSEFIHEQAQLFADDVRKKVGEDTAAQVRLVLRRVTQREPTVKEVERGVEYIGKIRAKHQNKPEESLRSFCLLALNLNEFIFVD